MGCRAIEEEGEMCKKLNSEVRKLVRLTCLVASHATSR
jgi:hypothetical protein